MFCKEGRIECDASASQQENCGLKCPYKDLDRFYETYVDSACWAECPDSRTNSSTENLREELGKDTLKKMREDCARFLQRFGRMIGPHRIEKAACDFWLSRQGHGSGFWSRTEVWGILTDKLDEGARGFGHFDDVIFLDPSEADDKQVLRAYDDYVQDFHDEHTHDGTWDGSWPVCVSEFKESEWFLNWLKTDEYKD